MELSLKVLLVSITWTILVSIRNAYFHPLSKFPGTRSAGATPIPFVRNHTNGNMVNWVMDLHSKYGEIVRIGPDELSFINPSAWQEIYVNKPQLPKPIKGVFKSYNGVPNLVTQPILADHARVRRIVGHALSKHALREQEGILKQYTDLLIEKLDGQIAETNKSSVALDIAQWYNYTTFDIIGDLLFNEPFHSLENSADHPWVAAIFNNLKVGVLMTAMDFFPPLPALVQRIMPQSLKDKRRQHFLWARDKISRRIATETDRPDFMTYILDNNNGKERMTRDEIDTNGSFLIVAGSETTATTCSAATFYLLENPAAYRRLKKEVRDAFDSMDDITAPDAGKLPYLHAVISEALRLHPAGPVSVPRVVDRPGVVISGREIPVGVSKQSNV